MKQVEIAGVTLWNENNIWSVDTYHIDIVQTSGIRNAFLLTDKGNLVSRFDTLEAAALAGQDYLQAK
jgi:hypothetical protein